jgi:hypothetical protein
MTKQNLAAAAALGTMFLGLVGAAYAQTTTPSPSPSSTPNATTNTTTNSTTNTTVPGGAPSTGRG